jgi:hypothetical protein
MHRTLCVALLVASCTAAAPLFAQSGEAPSGDARSAARELARKGDAEFAAGRCVRAIALWNKAEATFHAPTILLRIARCQALTGKVVEAAATLERVRSEQLPPGAPPAFVEAQRSAEQELPFIRSRIATLSVAVWSKGTSEKPRIDIDEKTMPAGRRSFEVDPGTHRVRVRAGGATWEGSLTLDEGEARALRISLRPDATVEPSRAWRNVGLTLGGVGIASMIVGAGFAVSAHETARELSTVCRKRSQCPASEQDNIDRLQDHALAADLTIGAGAAVFLTGAAVVLFEPAPSQEGPKVRLAPVGRGAVLTTDF